MQQHLSLPYYSQWADTKDSFWKERACAIAALKMILEYYGVASCSIDALIQEGIKLQGHDPRVGWKHNALKVLAQNYGIALDLREYKGGEELFKKALNEIQDAIEGGRPVLVSITRPSGGSHLVVIVGLNINNEVLAGFYINDPDDSQNGFGEGYFMSIPQFKERFRGLTLFALEGPVK